MVSNNENNTAEIVTQNQTEQNGKAIVSIITEIANVRNSFTMVKGKFDPFIKSCNLGLLDQAEIISMFINLLNISIYLTDADLSTISFSKDSIQQLKNEFDTFLKEKYGI